jgi:hypothetical protein
VMKSVQVRLCPLSKSVTRRSTDLDNNFINTFSLTLNQKAVELQTILVIKINRRFCIPEEA